MDGQVTDRPAWRGNEEARCEGAADPVDAAVGRLDHLAGSITWAKVGNVRLTSSTAVRLDRRPSTASSSGA
jgi:hypothetical protein